MHMHPPPGLEPVRPAPRSAPARLLEYRRGRSVALPVHASLELVALDGVIPVPGAPYYVPGLLPWQAGHVPLLDLNVLLRAYPEEHAPRARHALVVAWQPAPGLPLEQGALCAPLLVSQAIADDRQACPLPADSDLWPYVADACFLHDGQPVPVLDLARVFGQVHG